MNLKLKDIIILKGIIRCETGLRIGGEKSTIEIGGVDNPIIRNPIDDFPYIPGSSIKGKVRTLLEYALGKVDSENPHSCNQSDCPICLIFGRGKTDSTSTITGPSRAIFRDAYLTEESRKRLKELKIRKGLLYVEEKTENVINRIKGTAQSPRTMERVPAGTEFEFEIVYRIFEVIDDKGKSDNGKTDIVNFKYLLNGLCFLQDDALGSSGSRGYGKVSILIDNKDIKDIKPEEFIKNSKINTGNENKET